MERTRDGGRTMRPILLERFYSRWEFNVRHNLSSSDPEPLTLRELLELADPEARGLWEDLTLGYIEPDGNPLLRAAIAAQYRDVDPSEAVLTTGAQEAIYLAMLALVGAGDHVVIIGPAYQPLYEAVRVAGGETTVVPLLRGDRGWTLDMDAVVAALRAETSLLVVNFPHNPTGALPTETVFSDLLNLCTDRRIRFFSDEVFRGLEPDQSLKLPAAVELDGRALSIGDLSKSYGLAGVRVGWIACRDRSLLDRIAMLRDYTTICGSAPSQILALIGIRAREELQARARSIVAHNVATVSAFFTEYPDRVEWIPPAAGTTAFPRLLAGDVDAICERLASEQGVLLAPGSLFETSGGHFRLGLGHRHLERALPALAQALERRV